MSRVSAPAYCVFESAEEVSKVPIRSNVILRYVKQKAVHTELTFQETESLKIPEVHNPAI
jgi:hypothetical protein